MSGEVVRLVDRNGQLVGEACLACQEKDVRLGQLRRKISELENQADAQVERRHPLDAQIMSVCQFHKRLLSPTWKIVRNKGAYKDVGDRLRDIDAETGQPAFTVLHLQAASVGMSISAWVRERSIRSASWLFGSTRNVQWMLEPVVEFKRSTGASALAIVDELGRPGLERLAERCECGHLRLDHERENDAEGLWSPPCAVHGCACTAWCESLDSRVERWTAERERTVS